LEEEIRVEETKESRAAMRAEQNSAVAAASAMSPTPTPAVAPEVEVVTPADETVSRSTTPTGTA
jgi:hypothetical protein